MEPVYSFKKFNNHLFVSFRSQQIAYRLNRLNALKV